MAFYTSDTTQCVFTSSLRSRYHFSGRLQPVPISSEEFQPQQRKQHPMFSNVSFHSKVHWQDLMHWISIGNTTL